MKAVEKVEAHITAPSRRARRSSPAASAPPGAAGSSSRPVLTDVTTDMVITKEETFGPVAPLYRFKSEDEAVKMANDTEFGLASYFYSRDIGRIWRVAEALEYGIVGINEGIISTEIAPFGGMKESGIGPIWRLAGARNTASRNSSKSNTSAWAASTARAGLQPYGGRPRLLRFARNDILGRSLRGAARRRSNLAQRLRRRRPTPTSSVNARWGAIG